MTTHSLLLLIATATFVAAALAEKKSRTTAFCLCIAGIVLIAISFFLSHDYWVIAVCGVAIAIGFFRYFKRTGLQPDEKHSKA